MAQPDCSTCARLRTHFTFLIIVFVTLGMVSHAYAAPKLMWTAQGQIQQSSLTGKDVSTFVGNIHPGRLAVDLQNEYIYWTNNRSQIMRAHFDGAKGKTIIDGLSDAYAIALDLNKGHIFWSHIDTLYGQSGRADLDGTNIILGDNPQGLPNFYSNDLVFHPHSNALLSASKLAATISIIDTASFDTRPVVDSYQKGLGLVLPCSVAIDVKRNHVYWSSDNGIHRADIHNTDVNTNVKDILVDLDETPFDIALDIDHNHIYWTQYQAGTITRANLDGSHKIELITDLHNPGDLVLIPSTVDPLEALSQKIDHQFETVNKRLDSLEHDVDELKSYSRQRSHIYRRIMHILRNMRRELMQLKQ